MRNKIPKNGRKKISTGRQIKNPNYKDRRKLTKKEKKNRETAKKLKYGQRMARNWKKNKKIDEPDEKTD